MQHLCGDARRQCALMSPWMPSERYQLIERLTKKKPRKIQVILEGRHHGIKYLLNFLN